MPKAPAETTDQTTEDATPVLQPFLFPTVGTGLTVMAASLEDAERIVANLK